MDDYELMECIDQGLDVFGESLRFTVYWRMVILHNVPRGGILNNPEVFVKGLQEIYGAGSRQVEGAIVSRIKERFNLQYLESESLPDVIRFTRMQIAKLIELV